MAEQPSEALDDRQSQAQTFAPVVLRIGELIELAEDVPALFLRNAGAAVDHIDAHFGAATAASHEHTAAWCVTNGIRNEILDDASEQDRVASQPYIRRRDAQLEALLLRERLEFVAHPSEQTVQRKIDRLRRNRAGIEPRYVEQRIEQRVHGLRRRVYAIDETALLDGLRLRQQLRDEQPEGVHRLTKVVA